MAKKLKSLNPIIGTGYKTLSTIKDGEDGSIENFPDTLPKIPRLSYKRLGVSGLEIGWEFEDKIYYTYELYGSTTKGFEASEENLIFQGLASSYFYEAKPGEKWYFKARAKNTHGRYTEFSSELVTYTVKLDNLGDYVEGGSINGALIENATINNAHIKDLHADKITAGVLDADRIGANSITANKIEANAITTDKLAANIITSNHIQSGTITSGHIQSGTIESGHIKAGAIESDHIKSNSINSNHIQANTIQSEHIQTGAITAGSGIIAEGAIGSAQISSLDAAKIEAGTIDTSKVTIQGANGHLRLKGNRMQVFQGTGNQAKERVSVGDVNGDGSVYGLRVRGTDGQTILLDENGVKSEGITDGSITNDKISDDANIDGSKLNINSVVSKINEDGTETIQGTKIEVDGTTLNTKLSTITTKQTEDSERITQAQSQITANTNAIKLKVDEQTYTTDKKDMTSKLEKNTSEISAMKGQIALKVEQTDIENAKSEMEGVIDTKVDSAKSEIKVTTDAISQNVSNLSQTVSTKADGSTVSSLNSKVSSLETSVNGISGKVTSLEKTTTTLGTRVDTANTNASSALNKANSATTTANNAQNTANTNKSNITDLQGEVSTVKSNVASLEVTTSGISQKVSSVESTTATLSGKVDTANSNATNALNTANSTNTKLNNLQIGGRNLIRKANVIQNNSTATFNESTKTWTIKASAGTGGTWGCGLVLSSKNILVPYGKSYVLSFEIKVPRNCIWNVDINNYALTGSSWAGNDNDNTSKRTASSKNLTANQWIKCWVKWENTNTNNTTKVDLYDNSNFGVVMQNETSDMTYEIRNIQGELGNMPTEYTPAPEDVDGAINSVDSKVDTLRTEYNSTKSKVATIETNLSGITSRVSSAETNIEKISNASSQNLLYNSDFRIINGSLPDGWSVSDSSKITLDRNGTLLDGIPTFWFNVTGLTENTWKAVYSPFIEAKAGEKFVASAYVIGYNKWSTLDNGASLEIEYYNDSSRISTVSASVNKSNLNWQRLVAKGTAPTGTTRVRIRVHPIKNGQFNMSKPMLQYGETVTGWDRGFDIKNLTTRLATAESKITEDAITNTVKKSFYTKSETDSQITSKGYQTASQVQQTVNGLEVKVKQSGGYNNLFNSGFKKSTSYWSEQLYGTATNKSISTWDDSNQFILPNTKALVIRATNPTDRYGVHQNVKVKEGATYSISALSAGHRNTKQLITIRKASDGAHIANIEANPIGAGKNINNWRKMEGIFTIPSGCTEITVCLYMVGTGNNSDAYVWYTNVLLSEGKLVNEWSPHPSEVYDGITTIDKDGVTVTASNVKSKTNMSANGFKITKTDTNEDVFKVNADGTLYMKGQITVTGGSVPTSNLSGTISSNQLNSTITNDISTAKNNASNAVSTANTAKSTADSAKTTATTANNTANTAKATATNAQNTANTANTNASAALNTANTVNKTVNDNKTNWSNAYNRVKEWASGAVTGTTTINGGMITANTISVNKLAVGDFTNISQIDENLAPNGNTVITHSDNYKYFRFGNDSSAGYHSLYFATLNGGTFKVGDRFKFTFIGFGNKSISTAFIIRARYTDNTWNNLGSASYTFDIANKTRTVELQITSGLTAGKTLQRVQIFNEFSNTTGLVYMRNICINRMATGELIVDGSIKTSMIHSDGLNASVIKAGTISADRLDANTIVSKVNGGTTEINGNRIQTGTLSASKITTGTLDASKVNVTNLNASNIKSGKLSANYIDATNLSVKGELLSGQINGIGGMKFADGAVISSCESGVSGYKGIQISAPVIKLGDKVEINRPTIFYDVTGKNNSSSKTTTWTMSSAGALTCTSASISGTTTVGGTLNVRNNMINGMNNLQMGRGSVYIPIFGTNYTYDYIKGGASRIAFADSGPIHFLYNGSKSSFIAGGTVYLPHAGNANCDHFRLGSGIMASPSSGSFHFLTASGNTSPLYAGRLYSADVRSASEPMVISNNSAFDKINSVNVIETKNGLNLHNPISNINAIDESPEVVKTVYNEEKDEIKTSIDYTSAISTLWKAVQELKQENEELKEIIKDIHSKL